MQHDQVGLDDNRRRAGGHARAGHGGNVLGTMNTFDHCPQCERVVFRSRAFSDGEVCEDCERDAAEKEETQRIADRERRAEDEYDRGIDDAKERRLEREWDERGINK